MSQAHKALLYAFPFDRAQDGVIVAANRAGGGLTVPLLTRAELDPSAKWALRLRVTLENGTAGGP